MNKQWQNRHIREESVPLQRGGLVGIEPPEELYHVTEPHLVIIPEAGEKIEDLPQDTVDWINKADTDFAFAKVQVHGWGMMTWPNSPPPRASGGWQSPARGACPRRGRAFGQPGAARKAVVEKSNEITAVPALLCERDSSGTVTTMDALLTQRQIPQQILDQRGHNLMVVKANQTELCQSIEFLFANSTLTKRDQAQECWNYQSENKGHGRIERRTLESSTALCSYLEWPGVGRVMRRTCRRVHRKNRSSQHRGPLRHYEPDTRASLCGGFGKALARALGDWKSG